MRLRCLLKKTAVENLRDWKILVLTLGFAPFFVVLMYFYLAEATGSPYRVLVINRDAGAAAGDGGLLAGEALVSELVNARYPEGGRLFDVQQASETQPALERLLDGSLDLVVEIPEEFSNVLLLYRSGQRPAPAVVRTFGNPAAAKYLMAAVWSDMIAYEFAATTTGLTGPLAIEARSVTGPEPLTPFDLYVPALLAFGLIMLMFTAAASLIKEKDKGTMLRLRMSNMTNLEWFAAITLTQVVVGLLAMLLTLLTAVALGYEPSGSLGAVGLVGLVTCLSLIAISLLVAAFLRTIFDLLTIGCFPFFILIFFSGGMIPLPPLRLFTVGGRPINVNDFLPTTHTISALNQILNYDAGLGDVAFELGAILLLTLLYGAAGAWLFTKRHM